MTKRASTLVLLAVILAAVPLLLAAEIYRFTYDNPSIGAADAPFTLEYFSMPGCSSCLEFEKTDIEMLQPLIQSGELRMIYRDLPVIDDRDGGSRKLFCLQEHGDYRTHRRAAKLDSAFEWSTLPPLSGRAKARHQECLESQAPITVQSHNQADFTRRGFAATPAFTLVFAENQKAAKAHWTGRPSALAFMQAMETLQAQVGASDPRRAP